MKIKNSPNLNRLRLKAEEHLKSNYTDTDMLLPGASQTIQAEVDQLNLLHQLEVSQVELEMQNEELKLAVQKAETATALYDFSPVGYFTLSSDGNILQLNLRGAKMLGRERFNLINVNIKQFISGDSQRCFKNFFNDIFNTQLPQSCELRLVTDQTSSIFVQLEGIIDKDQQQCLLTALDISERKKKEEMLQQTQTNLATLINNRDESIWSVDHQYNLIVFNNFFRDECFASYNKVVKMGMNVLSFLPAHLTHLWKKKYDKALLGKRVVFEYSNQVDQETHHYEVFLNPIFSGGQITGVTALSVIVTWRKQAQEALRESEERHRLLADNASDVIWILNLEGKFTYVSPSVEKLTGYTPVEIMFHSMEDILTIESASLAYPVIKKTFDALRSGRPVLEINMELELNCKNGSTIWTDIKVSSMFNKEGEFIGLIGVSRNIAQRKRAEKALRNSEIKYRTLYESIIDGYGCVNMEGQLIDCNQSFEKMLGYNREELLQMRFTDLTPEKWHTIEKSILEEQVLIKGYSQVYEKEYIKKDGSVIPVELSTFVIKNELGENERICAIVRDITENKKINEALSKSEQLYHAIFEKSSAAMYLIDPEDGTIADANAAACRFYGYTRKQFKGMHISEINLMSVKQINEELTNAVHRKRLYYQIKHRLADSTIRDVEVYACPIEVHGRTLLHTIIHDITDRKLAEEALAASEIRFRSLLQNVSTVAVQGYGPDGRIQYWNHASEQLYGYTAHEAIGKDIIKLIVPSKHQENMKAGIAQMVASNLPLPPGELTLKCRNGSRVEVYANHAIVQIPGRAPELFCFDIDLTERKRAEEEVRERDAIFNQLLENSPIFIFFKDEKLRFSHVSQNFGDFMAESIDTLIGKTIDELFPAQFAEVMHQSDMEVLQNGARIEREIEINSRNYSIIKFPIQTEGKAPTIAGFIIDITDRKRAAQALKESEARLIELNATKDKFFSIIAHDLKSPFSSIIGFSNLLSRQVQENDYQGIDKYASIIQHSSQRAMNLLLNLLEWSRSQTNRIEFKPEPTDLTVLIQEVINLFIDTAMYKSITIDTDIERNFLVMADKSMIATVLRNLLSNAIKYTHPYGEILISTKNDQGFCTVTVADNGVGIKKEAIDKLFRIDVSYSTVGTQDEIGTGLGLILCKDFIDKHKGKIWVESDRGSYGQASGSQFHFTLPLV